MGKFARQRTNQVAIGILTISDGGLLMKFVYLLQSINFPTKNYIRSTVDMTGRLEKHNSGGSPHTSKYRPWKLICSIEFEDEKKADEFKRYLKTGSGRAFAKKHLW